MPAPILIIEDEPSIADTLLYALKSEGFAPQWCATGAAGLAALAQAPFALLVLDVGLPDANGFELCKQIRLQHTLPILFLTARNTELDRVLGLEIGADDYLCKPFSPRELTARIKAILRRSAPATTSPTPSPLPPLSSPASPFHHDPERCRITYQQKPLDLTRYEYRLLAALLASPGRVFNRDQLMNAAWEDPAASLDRTVDAHIKTLRAKLRAMTPDADPIQTHRGLGYSLRE